MCEIHGSWFFFDTTNQRVVVSPLLVMEVHSVSTSRSPHWPVGDLEIVAWWFLQVRLDSALCNPSLCQLLPQDPGTMTGGTPEERQCREVVASRSASPLSPCVKRPPTASWLGCS